MESETRYNYVPVIRSTVVFFLALIASTISIVQIFIFTDITWYYPIPAIFIAIISKIRSNCFSDELMAATIHHNIDIIDNYNISEDFKRNFIAKIIEEQQLSNNPRLMRFQEMYEKPRGPIAWCIFIFSEVSLIAVISIILLWSNGFGFESNMTIWFVIGVYIFYTILQIVKRRIDWHRAFARWSKALHKRMLEDQNLYKEIMDQYAGFSKDSKQCALFAVNTMVRSGINPDHAKLKENLQNRPLD